MIPLRNKTHFSLLQASSKPSDLVKFAEKHNLSSIGICDNNLSGIVELATAAKKAGIKPIFGLDRGYYSLFAQNKTGYINLNKISIGDKEEECTQGILFVAHDFLPLLLERGQPVEDWEYQSFGFLSEKANLYGKKNCYVGIGSESITANNMVCELAKKYNVNCIAAPHSFYPTKKDKIDHQVLTCIGLKETLKTVQSDESQHLLPYRKFFNENFFHILSAEEFLEYGDNTTIETTNDFCESVEPFDIFRPPTLPKFAENELELLKELCRVGWKQKIQGTAFADTAKNRILYELEVLTSAPILITYFLIVQDYIREARNRGELIGVGRGSSGGSLVSYLLDIIRVNPLQYDLIFERFYNSGRNTPGKISLPDIDTDFPTDKRQNTIDYLSNKYGNNKVAHITTFGTLKGRQSLKDILKVNDVMSFEEINHLTKEVPDEAAIADELQEMIESTGNASIVRWALENNPDHFMEYVHINTDGSLDGDLSYYFDQAIRLENIKRTRSKHASGIIIGDLPLCEISPLLRDEKTQEILVGVDMEDAEALGLVKFDILGVAVLKKMADIYELIIANF